MKEKEKDNVETQANLTQNDETEQGAEAQVEKGSADCLTDLGKFKSVDALLRAYNSLQAEFTRRSQRLKELEKDGAQNTPLTAAEPVPMPKENAFAPTPEPVNEPDDEQSLYMRVNACDKVKKQIIDDYLGEVKKSAVPLMSGGVSVISPAIKAKSVAEAGVMALGYFRDNQI